MNIKTALLSALLLTQTATAQEPSRNLYERVTQQAMHSQGIYGPEIPRLHQYMVTRDVDPKVATVEDLDYIYLSLNAITDMAKTATDNYLVLTSYGRFMFIKPEDLANPTTFTRIREGYDQGTTVQKLGFKPGFVVPPRNPVIVHMGKTAHTTILEEKLDVIMPTLPEAVDKFKGRHPISKLYLMNPQTGDIGAPIGHLVTIATPKPGEEECYKVVKYIGDNPLITQHFMVAKYVTFATPERAKFEDMMHFFGSRFFLLPDDKNSPIQYFMTNVSPPLIGGGLIATATQIPTDKIFKEEKAVFRFDEPLQVSQMNVR